MILAAATLFERELLRFYRDRGRVIGAFLPPVLFWLLLGSGLGSSFRLPGTAGPVGFLQFFFAGTLMLIVLFTSVFATISIIEDRKEGFLQAVLVSPSSRLAVVLGKVAGASAVGFLQGLAFLLFVRQAGFSPSLSGWLVAALALLLSSVGLTSLGFAIAWKSSSTQAFHAVMNLFLLPLWMLSGAVFPIQTAPPWLRLVMRINPVSYGIAAIQESLAPAQGIAGLPHLGASLAILALMSAALAAFAALIASRE